MRTMSIPPDKIVAFRKLLNPRWKLVFDIGIQTGWRISDILSLRPTDINADGTITIIAQKTGKASTVTLPPQLIKALRHQAGQFWIFPSPFDPVFPVTRQAALKAFKKSATQLNLSHVTPHSMRRMKAQALYKLGYSVYDIQAYMQHENLQTTLLYLFS